MAFASFWCFGWQVDNRNLSLFHVEQGLFFTCPNKWIQHKSCCIHIHEVVAAFTRLLCNNREESRPREMSQSRNCLFVGRSREYEERDRRRLPFLRNKSNERRHGQCANRNTANGAGCFSPNFSFLFYSYASTKMQRSHCIFFLNQEISPLCSVNIRTFLDLSLSPWYETMSRCLVRYPLGSFRLVHFQ